MEKKKVKLLAIQMESAIGNIDLNIETVKNLLRANMVSAILYFYRNCGQQDGIVHLFLKQQKLYKSPER